MINDLLFALTGHLKCRLIEREPGVPYFERYYVGQVLGVTFYLHRFISADGDKHVHNHPWGKGGAIVLSGGYIEEVATDICPGVTGSGCVTEQRKIRFFNRVNGNTFHRIEHVKPKTWTLFWHTERVRLGLPLKGWGFLSKQGAQTVFEAVPPAGPLEWWHAAKCGRDTERAPL